MSRIFQQPNKKQQAHKFNFITKRLKLHIRY
ncbi:hypothetical protein PTD2_04801 [Pseudoalteromonas tunicata D2]|uniref:Uncharacterized protein n=1 Tax=Pseudoalteromonas tunicata D2 TaxID=87626 RepID=A4CFQ0_9GAMM|nr:hypothetical protein PTD2_04801 [Pseudoalteromonas tunicata D2]